MHSQCQLYNEGDLPSQWKSDSKSSARSKPGLKIAMIKDAPRPLCPWRKAATALSFRASRTSVQSPSWEGPCWRRHTGTSMFWHTIYDMAKQPRPDHHQTRISSRLLGHIIDCMPKHGCPC